MPILMSLMVEESIMDRPSCIGSTMMTSRWRRQPSETFVRAECQHVPLKRAQVVGVVHPVVLLLI